MNHFLASSPDIVDAGLPIQQMEGFSSAALAFNNALALERDKRFAVLVHQDVYLPRDFLRRLAGWISHIEEFDREWAVIGSIGITDEHQLAGQVWSNSANGVIISASVG